MRKSKAVLFLSLLPWCLSANAQSTVDLDKVQTTIVFLYDVDMHGHENTSVPLATAFFVGVPQNGDGESSQGIPLLITARHVVDPVWAGCATANPTRLFMRLNTRDFNPSTDDTGVDYVPLGLISTGPKKNVFTSVDESVDAAVINLTPIMEKVNEKFAVQGIDLSNFATREEATALKSGAEIVSTGLLPDFPGVRRNYPMVKFGHISTKSQERVRVTCGPAGPMLRYPLRLWLIAANLVAGNSGSPVFFAPPRSEFAPVKRATLIGLQSCSWVPSDIAGMTPIDDIYEIIQAMELPNADLYRGPPKPTNKKP